MEHPSVYVRYGTGFKRLAEDLMTDRDPLEPPKVFWLYGKSGGGKSYTTYMFFKDKGGCYRSRNNIKWFNKYRQETCLLLDDIRSTNVEFNDLLNIIDCLPYSVETKGGEVPLKSKFIVITAPRHWNTFWPGAAEDFYQLERRITKTISVDDFNTELEFRNHLTDIYSSYY